MFETALKQKRASLKLSQCGVLSFCYQSFGVTPYCSSGFAVHGILCEICMHGKSIFFQQALDVFLDSSVSGAAKSFLNCFSLSERCSGSHPALLCMCRHKHGCAQAAVKSMK